MLSSLPAHADCFLVTMEAHDHPPALAIHADLLTRGSQADDIGLWMSEIKPLIMHVVVGKIRYTLWFLSFEMMLILLQLISCVRCLHK